MNEPRKNIAVLVSGRGSNLQSLIDAADSFELPAEIKIVISNEPDAFALVRAKNAGITATVIDHRDFKSRESFEDALINTIDNNRIEYIVLAGFMRILTPHFVNRYPQRIINIHPALLPSFPGTHAQKQALDCGVKISGVTVHFVDTGTDTGPIIAQTPVQVLDDDTVETLSARILEQEHRIFPNALKLVLEGRLEISGNRVKIKKEVQQ
jgi:phosphoribosylglycinamide formyltransferase-1